MNKNIKAVTIGDIEGIGIRILINLWKYKKNEIGKFFLITNFKLFQKFIKKNNIKLQYIKIKNISEVKNIYLKKLPILNIEAKNNIYNTYNSLKEGFILTKKKYSASLITLPVNKEKIINEIDSSFIGQTEMLQKLDKKKYSNMIFYSKKIIVIPLTTHIALNKINNYLKRKNNIFNKLVLLNRTLKHDFKIPNPKFIICGVNPHAGENGTIGKEEIKFLNPIIKKIKKRKINIDGPFSSDTIFNNNNIKKYDCFISIYHDQALIPFKIINGFNGVNYTASLSIIRTSPTHGTGYDLINKKNINTKSLLNSFKLANIIYKNRLK